MCMDKMCYQWYILIVGITDCIDLTQDSDESSASLSPAPVISGDESPADSDESSR